MADTALYDTLLQVAQKRRNNRKFKSDPIPDGYIEKIIDVARWAPSGFHTQPWEFVAIPDDQRLDSGPVASFRDAPAFIFALCDYRAYVGLPMNVERDNPIVDTIFCSSMASTFLLMHLAAASLGLSSQWYSAAGSPAVEQEIRNLIGIPDDLKIYDLMVLGYPAVRPVPKEVRAVKDMLHYNACGKDDFRSKEQVEKEAAITKAWCLSAH